MMGSAGDGKDAHWRSGFKSEEHRMPRVTELSMPLQAANEEMDFGVARPPDDGLGLPPIREAARSRTGSVPQGFISCNALTALEVVDLVEERHRVRDKGKRLYARLPRLDESPKTYAEVELFLTAKEGEAERAGLQGKLYELAINQLSFTLAMRYRRLSATKFPGFPPSHERLAEAMVESVVPRKPQGHLGRWKFGLSGNSWTGCIRQTWPCVAGPTKFR